MDLQNTLRELFAGRRVENNTQSSEPAPPAPAPPAPEPEEEEEGCTVCLMPMETPYKMPCGHEICVECKGHMMTQNIGNGCVGQHRETGIKVIKCPVCRREDAPTREELIAEIVRIRRGGNFDRIQPPRPVVPPRQPVHHHNLPAVIPVLQPVILNPQPAPAPAPAPVPIEVQREHFRAPFTHGRWLREGYYQPIRDNNDNYFQQHQLHHRDQRRINNTILRWNILQGHPIEHSQRVTEYLQASTAVANGFICGQVGQQRFYHHDFFIPENTEGNVPARRLCNNGEACEGNRRSRTARRCSGGCGQFICNRCHHCNNLNCLNH